MRRAMRTVLALGLMLLVGFVLAPRAAHAQADTPANASEVTAAQDPAPKISLRDPEAEAREAELAARDPFVRGLKRLDTFLRLRDEAEQRTQQRLERIKAEEAEAERAALGELPIDADKPPAPISDPSFVDAFDPKRYRLDGLLISQAPAMPVIHVVESRELRTDRILFWSGRERRWVYIRGKDESLPSVARQFNMMTIDLLQINEVSAQDALADRQRLYVSPRDNGPLIHIVRSGETLKRLSKFYRKPVDQLRARNRTTSQGWLLIGQRFLVRDKTITADMAKRAVAAPSTADRMQASQPRKFYARIGQHKTEIEARRAASEIYASLYDYMDSDIIIRREQDPDQGGRKFYNIDIGPMRNKRHAEAYCAIYRQQEMPCLAIQRLPGPERRRNFESQAIVSVTPYVFYNKDGQENRGRADLDALKQIEYNLVEGQALGNEDGTVAKITATEIYVIDKFGYVLSLPLAYIPEVDPQVQAAQEAQQRQDAVEGVAGAIGGATAGVGELEAPDPNIGLVDRLTDGESDRRGGSTGEADEIVNGE